MPTSLMCILTWGVASLAEIRHKQNHDVSKTTQGIVSLCELFDWTCLCSFHWEHRVLPGSFSFRHQSASVYPASAQGVEGFPLTSELCGEWKSGSMGFLRLQKPRRGQGNQFSLGADQVVVISGTFLPLGATG